MSRFSLPSIAPDWDIALNAERQLLTTPTLATILTTDEPGAYYPPPPLIFNAFTKCPYEQTRVIILGQDPYHQEGQAHGLAFSVPDNVPIPPSLRNIFQELVSDLHVPLPSSGNLERWARQGVLLLNSTLTVAPNSPGSHQSYGWENFTDAVIQHLSNHHEHLVFLLWGKSAEAKRPLINSAKHLVLVAPHPSPLSAYRGFFGCRHFSQTNQYLQDHNRPVINW